MAFLLVVGLDVVDNLSETTEHHSLISPRNPVALSSHLNNELPLISDNLKAAVRLDVVHTSQRLASVLVTIPGRS